MRKWLFGLLGIAVLGGLAAGGWYYAQGSPERAGELLGSLGFSSSSPDEGLIQASGTIEAEEVSVTPELAGRILEISVDEGDEVTTGQRVVRLDRDLLAAEREQSQAAVALAEAQLARVEAGAKPQDVAATEAAVEVAQASRERARAAWENALRARDDPQELDIQIEQARTELEVARRARQQALAQVEAKAAERQAQEVALDTVQGEFHFTVDTPYGPQVVKYSLSEGMVEPFHFDYDMSTYDWWQAWVDAEQARIAVEGAERGLRSLLDIRDRPLQANAAANAAFGGYQRAEAGAASAQARLELARAGATPEQIAVAEAAVAQAEAALGTLDVQMAKLTLESPIGGLVTQRLANEGELAMPGVPVLKVASLDALTLTVYVPENELGRVKVGQRATVRVDSFPERSFHGEVTYIASQAQFTPKNVQTREERVNTVFGVEIEIPNPGHELKPGMPADATIEATS